MTARLAPPSSRSDGDGGAAIDDEGDPDAYAAGAAAGSGDTTTNSSALSDSTTDAGTPSCVLDAEQEQGPYYLDLGELRSDVTEGKPGIPLALALRVVDVTTCQPLRNAAVDIWHCDASGVYSGFAVENTEEETYLRGLQVTDANGVARFATIVPGWYAGRAVHIHMKVRVAGATSGVSYAGGHTSHTGQLFIDAALLEQVALIAPYSSNTTVRTLNDTDHVWTDESGSEEVLTLIGSIADGFSASVDLGIDPNATPAAAGGMLGGSPGGMPGDTMPW